MAVQSLAVKYRPKTFDDVTEQGSVKIILEQQLASNSTKNAYLFCGGAGTGKTTCARIFANEINKGLGNPIELDAASNNSVDNIRDIITQAKNKAIDGGEYKVFIIDECHMLSNGAWNAFLKLLEEPPAKSIFIMCTTDPQKIPKTILSRVQRYNFQRISHKGIVERLKFICDNELQESFYDDSTTDVQDAFNRGITYISEAIEYIAKVADGGMRDAITLLDKCLAYSTDLTMENVVKALGVADYETMFNLTDMYLEGSDSDMVSIIEDIHMSGKDLKQFIRTYMGFILDVCKFDITKSFNYISIPNTFESKLKSYASGECKHLLNVLIRLNNNIKWDSNPKEMIEATFLSE